MGLAPEAVVIYVSQNIRYLAPVKPGDTVTATVKVTNVDTMRSRVTVEAKVTNQERRDILEGEAELQVEATM
jgi:acyl dehydratase